MEEDGLPRDNIQIGARMLTASWEIGVTSESSSSIHRRSRTPYSFLWESRASEGVSKPLHLSSDPVLSWSSRCQFAEEFAKSWHFLLERL